MTKNIQIFGRLTVELYDDGIRDGGFGIRKKFGLVNCPENKKAEIYCCLELINKLINDNCVEKKTQNPIADNKPNN